MTSPSYYEIVCLLSVLLLLIISGALFRCRSKYRHLHARYVAECLEKKALAEQCLQLEQKIVQQDGFESDLSRASATNMLHLAGFEQQYRGSSGQSPERYHYAKRLVENGMDAEAIASLLAISLQEAQQLVSLTKLACK